MITYSNFEEIESEIQKDSPPTVYKYRTWEDNFHKKIITENEVWFAHPHTLNDPYDIRPPYNFIIENLDLDVARRKIWEAGRVIQPNLSDKELSLEVEKRILQITKDPTSYFKQNRKDFISDQSKYNRIGVLSSHQLLKMKLCGRTMAITIMASQ